MWEAQVDPWVGKIPRRREWLLTAVSCLIRVLCLIHVCFSGTWAHTRNLICLCGTIDVTHVIYAVRLALGQGGDEDMVMTLLIIYK